MDDPGTRSLSMEFEGLGYDDFAKAVGDERTAVVNVPSYPETYIPLAIPIEHLPWYNQPYFEQFISPGGAVYYYNNQPPLLDEQPEAYMSAMAPVTEQVRQTGGLLTTDHSHLDKPVLDRDIAYLAAAANMKPKDVVAQANPPAQHYMYARQLLHRNRIPPRHTEIDLYEEYVAAGERGAWSSERAELQREITGGEAEQIWEYYYQAFSQHNAVDPILASFTHDQFVEILDSPQFHKFVYREKGAVANVLLIADIRLCPWMNQAYYEHHYPSAYQTGNIYYSPGVVSDPETNTPGKSLMTMGLLIKTFCQAEIEPVITFVCDEVSNTQVPKLTEHSVNRTGVLTTDLSHPDALHVIRGFSFK